MRGKYTVACDQEVYFLKSEQLAKEFVSNTFSYVGVASTKKSAPMPLVVPSLFVLGPPKSGKSLVARKISESFNLVYLTVPIVLEAILEGNDDSELHDTVLIHQVLSP